MIRDKNERKLSSAGSASHKIRITGGLWKRTPLAVPDVAGLRPTPDRVRETLFNWLTHLRGSAFRTNELSGTCLREQGLSVLRLPAEAFPK